MLNRKLSMAFEKWQAEAAQMARGRFLLNGAVTRMRKRKLSMAFEKWQYTAKQLAREQYALGGAVTRMRKRKLSMAFETWQAEAARMGRGRFLLNGAVKRMRKRKLSMAFEKWQYTAKQLAREQYMLNGAVTRMRKRKLSMAFEKWQYWSQERRRQKELIELAVTQLRLSSLLFAYDQWRYATVKAKSPTRKPPVPSPSPTHIPGSTLEFKLAVDPRESHLEDDDGFRTLRSGEQCANCGNTYMSDALFCRKCGTRRKAYHWNCKAPRAFGAGYNESRPLSPRSPRKRSESKSRSVSPGSPRSPRKQSAVVKGRSWQSSMSRSTTPVRQATEEDPSDLKFEVRWQQTEHAAEKWRSKVQPRVDTGKEQPSQRSRVPKRRSDHAKDKEYARAVQGAITYYRTTTLLDALTTWQLSIRAYSRSGRGRNSNNYVMVEGSVPHGGLGGSMSHDHMPDDNKLTSHTRVDQALLNEQRRGVREWEASLAALQERMPY